MQFYDKYSFRTFLGLLIVFCWGLSSCGDSESTGASADDELVSSSSEGGTDKIISSSSLGDLFQNSSSSEDVDFSSSSLKTFIFIASIKHCSAFPLYSIDIALSFLSIIPFDK